MKFITLYIAFAAAQLMTPKSELGCAVADDSIYLFGGKNLPKHLSFNRNVYKWSLKDGIKLDNEVGDWKEVAKIENDDIICLPAISTNPKYPKDIFIFGGTETHQDINLRIFNTETNDWTSNDKAMPELPVFKKGDVQFKDYTFVYGELVAYEDSMIYIGGIVFDRSIQDLAPNEIFFYNPSNKTGKFKVSNNPLETQKSFVYKDKIYSWGGSDRFAQKRFDSTSLQVYDLKTNSWSIIKPSGRSPFYTFSFSSVLVDNKFYLIPGTRDNLNQQLDEIFLFALNLDTLTWENTLIDGFKASDNGCLVHYKGKLIYSFGNSTNLSIKSQIIDTKTMKLEVQKKSDEKDGETANPSPNPTETTPQAESNQAAIIGGSVGGGLFLILLIAFVIYWFRIRRPQNNEGMDTSFQPKPLFGYHWSDRTSVSGEQMFSLESSGAPTLVATNVPPYAHLKKDNNTDAPTVNLP